MRSHVLLAGSGTQALTIAIAETFRKRGRSSLLAIPAFSCFDVATAAIATDARVVLYDLDPVTLAPDLGSFEGSLRNGAGVAVIAPLYGIPVDWPALTRIADRYGADLIEDAAQGHGALWDGKPLGSLGEMAVLSFGRGKGWTGGAGGAVLASSSAWLPATTLEDPGLAGRAAIAAGVIGQFSLARPAVYQIPCSIPALRLGQTTYVPPRPPRSLSREAAATLLATYAASQHEGKLRRARGNELLNELSGKKRISPIIVSASALPGYLRFPVRVPHGMASFASEERALRLGIAPSYPLPLSRLPALRQRLSGNRDEWPGAETLVRELVTLPTHSRVDPTESAEILSLVRAL